MRKHRRLKLFKVTMVEEIPVRIYDEDGEEYIEFDDEEPEEWTAEVVLVARSPLHAKVLAMRHNKGEVVQVRRYYDLTDKRFFERVMGRSMDVIEEVLDD